MKNKNIIFVVLIIVILSILYFKQMRSVPIKSDSGGYSKIFPDDFNPDQLKKIKFFPPEKEDKATTMEMGKDGNWIISSLFFVKGNKQSITNLLNDLKNLEGEERASAREVFSDFGIQDQEVYHLALFGTEDKERYHLLIGKPGPNYSDGFIRFKDKNNVFLVNKNIRSTFGISGDNHEQIPDSKKWAEKKIFELTNDKFAKITLIAPGNKIVMEKREKENKDAPVVTPKKPPAEAEKKKEFEWWTLEPVMKEPVKKEQADSIISVLGNFLADDFADPQRVAEYGIKESQTTLTISSDDKKEYKLFLGKKEGEKYYLMQDGDPMVYLINDSRYKNSFEKISEIIKPSKIN